MARFLICCTPVHGHLAPLLSISQALVGCGHQVTVLTGSRFEAPVVATGADHVALPRGCDYDDRDLDGSFPERASKRGPARLNFDVQRIFADAIPYQHQAFCDLRGVFSPDVVLIDPVFIGAAPLILSPATNRPALVICNVLPLTISSRDTAPFGLGIPPSSRRLGRARNAALRLVVERLILRSGQRRINQMLESVGSPRLPVFFLDAPVLADRFLQLTVPSFEYTRSDLPATVRFVGAVLPPPSEHFDPPDWWAELDGPHPVVHVTQGTIDNADLSRLVLPTLAALRDENVLVVVATGGRPASAIPGPLPSNVRVAQFIAYDRLLAKVDLMVTNGGYGGVHWALSQGVPLVVAGATEDKPEVAARVAWAGVGINLGRSKPTPDKLLSAVRRVLADPSYRNRARALQAELAACDALGTVTEMLEGLVGEHLGSPGALA